MLALIGGTGLDHLEGLIIERREHPVTPYGDPSAPLSFGRFGDHELVFLARHGDDHTLPPHRVNYRANLWALRQAGAERIIAATAVGGITPAMDPGRIVIPDQLIDYTHDRHHTFHDGPPDRVEHIDFTWPYCETLRRALIDAAREIDLTVREYGVYGTTQGPRLETAAEIRRLERDGCDIVGMTGMPEAALARELELAYAGCSLVVNRAAGKSPEPITMDAIRRQLDRGMADVRRLLTAALPRL